MSKPENYRFTIQNFMKLSVVEIDTDDNLTIITGGNDQGKSCTIKALRALFGGKKFIPDNPIRDGEAEAVITGEIGDIKATLKITRKEDGNFTSTLKLKSKDGATYSSPQEKLNAIIGREALDPEAFLRMDDQKQVETLLKTIDLKVDEEGLANITGIPRKNIPCLSNPLDVIKWFYNELYDSRRLINRDLERAQKHLETLPEVEETQEVSTTELVAEKERLTAENQANQEKRDEHQVLLDNISTKQDEIKNIEAEIERLQELLKQKRFEKDGLEFREFELATEIGALEDHDLTEINKKISEIDQTNQQAKTWKDRQRAIEDVEGYQKDSDTLTEKLEAVRRYKEELLTNAKFPVPGLGFGENGVTLNGKPFKTGVSASDQFVTSFAIAASQDPKPSIIIMENAEKCGQTKRDLIRKLSAKCGIKTIIEVFNESDDAEGIVIEDGHVKAVNKAVTA